MLKKGRLGSFLEGVVLLLLVGSLIWAPILPLWRILGPAVFLGLYFYFLLLYHRKTLLKLFLRFHLLELILFPLSSLLSGGLIYLSLIFFLGSRDYGAPMVVGFIAGVFFLVFFPPLFLGIHQALVFLARRLEPFSGVSRAEAWRLSLLALGAFLLVFSGLRSGLSRYAYRSGSHPKVLSGPEITFHPLPGNSTGYYALVSKEFLRGRKVLSQTLQSPGRKGEVLFRSEVGGHLLLYTLSSPELIPGQSRIRLETQEHLFAWGDFPGPIYELPVQGLAPAPVLRFKGLSWGPASHPGLRLELESLFPQEILWICFNFGGELGLKAGRDPDYRDLVLQVSGGLYYREGKEEYLCYEPPGIPGSPVVGNFTVFFPLSKEDFGILRRRGLVPTGFKPLPVKILVRGRSFSGIIPHRTPLKSRFETLLPFPR